MPIPRYFITQYTTFPAQRKVSTYHRDEATNGSNIFTELSEEVSPLDVPNYTDADICAALANALKVDANLVAMDPLPSPMISPTIEEDKE